MITRELVEETQKDWGNGVVTIGKLKDDRSKCENFTNAFVEKLYAFTSGPVLFKPTLAVEEQFRSTFEGALSYLLLQTENVPKTKDLQLKDGLM